MTRTRWSFLGRDRRYGDDYLFAARSHTPWLLYRVTVAAFWGQGAGAA